MLDLVNPATGAVTAIPGFSRTEKFGGGHGEGTTSADEGGGYLFATDRTGGELVVVDPKGNRIVSRAPLSAGPDYVRYVAPTGEVWVTEPDKERIEVFRLEGKDPVRPVAAGIIPVKGGPESLVIDGKRGRAYSHLWEGRTVAIVDIIDYSPSLRHLYLPGGKSATMAIFGVSKKGILSPLATVKTAEGAHCVAADVSGKVYVCDPKNGRLIVVADTYPRAR